MTFKSTLSDLYHEETNFQFTTKIWRWGAISGLLIAISIGSLFVNGLNTSIEFKGGTSFELKMSNKKVPSVADVRDLLATEGLADSKVQIVNNDTVKIVAKKIGKAEQNILFKKLSDYSGTKIEEISFSDVGPSWGKQLTSKAVNAMIAFFALVALYMIIRFEWSMALASISAVIHDIIITVGVYSVFNIMVSPATVVAFLTILGFSLYDTVVVFDKVRDNQKIWQKLRQTTYSEMVNTSLNQVLMRSINTSIVAVLPVISLIFVGTYLLGAVALLDFALALAIGLATGAYSSIYVATPLIVVIKRWSKKVDNI
ncbi:MAG: protein translocase subunit SecF [Acidimicrobiia bacterium]|nr:protein translocase subunit SecF [Acidimicrobiia bacterium]